MFHTEWENKMNGSKKINLIYSLKVYLINWYKVNYISYNVD